MSDFNRNMKLLVTVIEGRETKSFLINSMDCPFDCELEEFHSILKTVFENADYECVVNQARKRHRPEV